MANMQNVKFQYGRQSKLEERSSYEAGTFYVTTDTHRLYLGNGDNGIDLLSQAIVVVNDSTELNSQPKQEGQFYFVKSGNQLVVYKGTQFVQINPDTIVTGGAWEVDPNGNGLVFNIVNDDGSGTDVQVPTAPIKFAAANGSAVTVSATADASGNAAVTVGSKPYTIDAELIEVGSGSEKHVSQANYKLQLDGNDIANSDTISIVQGDNIKLSKDSNNNLVISAAGADEMSVLQSVTLSTGSVAGGTNGFKINVADAAGSVEDDIDPTVVVGVSNNQKQTIHFNNGIAALPVYTSTEIDDKFKGLDGLKYQGTMTSAKYSDLAPGSQEIGWMYKVAEADGMTLPVSGGTGDANLGDLIIANGEEGTDGKILAGSLYWDIIPAGDDIDSQYDLRPLANGAGAKIICTTAGSSDFGSELGSLQIAAADNYITVTPDNSGSNVQVAKIGHKTYNATGSADSSTNESIGCGEEGQFTAITGLTVENGHITGWKTGTLSHTDNYLDAVNTTLSLAAAVTGTNASAATIDLSGNIKDQKVNVAISGASVGLSSNTLVFNKSNNNLVVDMVWESFEA